MSILNLEHQKVQNIQQKYEKNFFKMYKPKKIYSQNLKLNLESSKFKIKNKQLINKKKLMPIELTYTTTIFTNIEFNDNNRDNVCKLSVNSGNCQNYQNLWHFDSYSGKCYSFIYSGCGGNANRFSSQIECERYCGNLISHFNGSNLLFSFL